MKLAVLLQDLASSQLACSVIAGANYLGDQGTDVVVLYENLARPCIQCHFASMQVSEGWGFDGVAIATSITTAEKVIRMPSPEKKLFVVWDLEWLRQPKRSYREYQAVYGNEQLTLLARSASHADAISRCWGKETLFVGDFDFHAIMEAARS